MSNSDHDTAGNVGGRGPLRDIAGNLIDGETGAQLPEDELYPSDTTAEYNRAGIAYYKAALEAQQDIAFANTAVAWVEITRLINSRSLHMSSMKDSLEQAFDTFVKLQERLNVRQKS